MVLPPSELRIFFEFEKRSAWLIPEGENPGGLTVGPSFLEGQHYFSPLSNTSISSLGLSSSSSAGKMSYNLAIQITGYFENL